MTDGVNELTRHNKKNLSVWHNCYRLATAILCIFGSSRAPCSDRVSNGIFSYIQCVFMCATENKIIGRCKTTIVVDGHQPEAALYSLMIYIRNFRCAWVCRDNDARAGGNWKEPSHVGTWSCERMHDKTNGVHSWTAWTVESKAYTHNTAFWSTRTSNVQYSSVIFLFTSCLYNRNRCSETRVQRKRITSGRVREKWALIVKMKKGLVTILLNIYTLGG